MDFSLCLFAVNNNRLYLYCMNFFRLILLFPLSLLYDLTTSVRNMLFERGIFPSETMNVNVISIGNLNTGGSGKTPFTEYIAKIMNEHNFRVAVLSRGYKRKSKGFRIADAASSAEEFGEEALQHVENLPFAPVAVCESRRLGIQMLLQECPDLDLVLLDDAFQHRYVKPSLSILLTDFSHPYYRDFLLPSGNLRESSRFAKRADILIVTKCPTNLPPQEMKKTERELKPAPHQSLFFTSIRYHHPMHIITKKELILDKEQTVLLVTGIANATPLMDYIKSKTGGVIHLSFRDHHSYSRKDLLRIKSAFDLIDHSAKLILTTQKDAIRLRKLMQDTQLESLPFYLIPIHVEFLNNQSEQFIKTLISYVGKN